MSAKERLDIPDGDHVVHYCGGKTLESNNRPGPAAFALRPQDEDGLSCNWLEYFSGTRDDQLSKLRQALIAKSFSLGATAVFACFPVGLTRKHLEDRLAMKFRIVWDELETDKSHSLITDSQCKIKDALSETNRDTLASELAECCESYFSARDDKKVKS